MSKNYNTKKLLTRILCWVLALLMLSSAIGYIVSLFL